MDYGQRSIASSKVADDDGCKRCLQVNVIVAISTLEATIRKTQLSLNKTCRARSRTSNHYNLYVRLSEEHHHRERVSISLPSDEQVVDKRSTTARSPPAFGNRVCRKSHRSTCRCKRRGTRRELR
jgi:hypothetical protein